MPWTAAASCLITQSMSGLVALALAVLTYRGLSVVWPIYALSAVGAAVSSFDLPARQALVPALVPREHLPNAINLNSILFQTASVVGTGDGRAGHRGDRCRVGLSFQRRVVRLRDPGAAADARHPRASAGRGRQQGRRVDRGRNGGRCASSSAHRSSARRCCWISSRRSSHRPPRCCRSSRRTSCRSAPAATAGCSRRQRSGRSSRASRWSRRPGTFAGAARSSSGRCIGHGVATIVFGFSRSFWLTFTCLALVGATDTVSTVLRNIIRQLETPDRLRGRMTGINMVFFMGGPQLGELEAGAVANGFGAPVVGDQRRHRVPDRNRLGRDDHAAGSGPTGCRQRAASRMTASGIVVGLISDTHGQFRPQIPDDLRGCGPDRSRGRRGRRGRADGAVRLSRRSRPCPGTWTTGTTRCCRA